MDVTMEKHELYNELIFLKALVEIKVSQITK